MVDGLKASKQIHKTFMKDTGVWEQTPEVGAEGLIATIEGRQELLQALSALKYKEIMGQAAN